MMRKVRTYSGNFGWWARIEGHGYPFGNWFINSGPYPFRWMAKLSFPILRWTR